MSNRQTVQQTLSWLQTKAWQLAQDEAVGDVKQLLTTDGHAACIVRGRIGPADTVVGVCVLDSAGIDASTVARCFGLSPRLSQVAVLLARRLTNAEIACALGIRPATARHHTERVLARLGAQARTDVAPILLERLAELAFSAPTPDPERG
jgi:DNA-binding CsgD family transcriptional regulator